MFEETKRFCDSLLDRGLPGYDLSVFHKGKEILRIRNGWSDLENGVRIDGREKYNIYSCSKPITCVAAMQLWEKGAFRLDDRLSDYMPEFSEMTVLTENGVKKAERPILIKNLFGMSAGLTYNRDTENIRQAKIDTGGRCPTREVMKYLAKDPLASEPGTVYRYSLAHDVLAALVEVLSGQLFNDYVTEHIFAPLGMKDSTFLCPKEKREELAVLYSFDEKAGKPVRLGHVVPVYMLGTEYASGGGGCVSTVDDYMKFLEGWRTRVLLKDETVQLMKTDQLHTYESVGLWKDANHGYGLGIRCGLKGGRFQNYGWGGAACAYLAVDDEHELSLYFASHLLKSPVQGIRSYVYRFVCAELFGTEKTEDLYRLLNQVHHYDLPY